MSRRKNGVRKAYVAKLNAINALDKKIKRKTAHFREEELEKLLSQRKAIINQLKKS